MEKQIEKLGQQIDVLCRKLKDPAISKSENDRLVLELERACMLHLQLLKEREKSG